jgi:two-component system phosphate regulon sensor histidine kinase PhoR
MLARIRLPRGVSQALVNLLDNAAKYSGESKSIAVRTYAENGCAVLEVEDHGIGIPREEQDKIFRRFYRVGNAVAKGGYGLGLYLVRHIMDAHQGRVELESELRRGSRFRLLFPAVEPGPHL